MSTLTGRLGAVVDACVSSVGAVAPLPLGDDAEPVFAEPWQAEAFATIVHLSEKGLFTWKEWVSVFSAEIAENPQRADESAPDAYFRQWLAAVEKLLVDRNLVTSDEIADTQEHWRRSYINTEHGHPVEFLRTWGPPDPELERILTEHAHHHDHDDHEPPRPIAVSVGQQPST